TNGSYVKLVTKSSTGGAIGAAMLLKVMSGDQINTAVDYYWPSATMTASLPTPVHETSTWGLAGCAKRYFIIYPGYLKSCFYFIDAAIPQSKI
ncbi:hypothetical protein, partial [Parafilimonas sp.]|uniref:hypothetical protein n=1 Tax=Parafilimonas sp. TaxID=1969739 RepID=UPI0039E494FD